MRVIKHCFFVFLLIQGCNVKSPFRDSTAVIHSFIEKNINQKRFDIRMFDPPPPPELQDSIPHSGRIKPDSIIKKLAPLQVYVNPSIVYDNEFKPKVKPVEGFDFIKSEREKGGRLLEISRMSKKKGIILHSISSDNFFQLHKSINLQEGYGGFVSFKNLYYSKDGGKAYFEFVFYRRKLNSSTSIIYAEKQNDGTWKFSLDTINIS